MGRYFGAEDRSIERFVIGTHDLFNTYVELLCSLVDRLLIYIHRREFYIFKTSILNGSGVVFDI
jgi:hypothetical protein